MQICIRKETLDNECSAPVFYGSAKDFVPFKKKVWGTDGNSSRIELVDFVLDAHEDAFVCKQRIVRALSEAGYKNPRVETVANWAEGKISQIAKVDL